MKKGNIALIVLFIILIAVVGGGFFFYLNKDKVQLPVAQEKIEQTEEKLGQQIKSLHFETSSPAHGEVFAQSPVNVVINFNFDLGELSEIKIEKDGMDYGVGKTVIDKSKLALRRELAKDLEDGIYTVSYKACWPDRSCHDGMHQFEIKSSTRSAYSDLTGKKEVEITLDNIAFSPEKIIISKGTKVTWVNKDPLSHYVNTDPHAGHNHFIYLNSKVLSLNDKYTYTFEAEGEYPYHCSAHASDMIGRILVE